MSTVKANDILEATSGGGKFFVPRAWVNWKNSGGNSLVASGNISSVADNGTGVFTTNFTTSFSAATYALSGACNTNNTANIASIGFNTNSGGNTYTTSACGHTAEDVDGSRTDYINNTVMYVGDQ